MPATDTLPATMIPNIYFPCAYSGTVDASDFVFALSAPVGFELHVGLPGSVARARAASTGNSVFLIQKNGGNIGTITFSAATTGVFSLPTQTPFAIGDLLEIVAPAVHDATLADLRITIAAVQTG